MRSYNFSNNSIVEIYEYEEFMKYAKGAPLIIYDPEFFPSPFLNEQKIRCVNCYAIGVNFQGLPIILKYQKSRKNSHFPNNRKRMNPKDVIDSSMRVFINELQSQIHAVKGTIHGEKQRSIWDDFIL